MTEEKVINAMKKLGYSEKKAEAVAKDLCTFFGPNKGNKDEMKAKLKEKYDLATDETDKIYKELTKELSENFVEKIKSFFSKN